MENAYHASEQLFWMVRASFSPDRPRQSCCRETPILPSSTWKSLTPTDSRLLTN